MNKQNPNKRGIETLLSDEELLGYMLAPERRDFARREHKRVRRKVEDLEAKLNAAKSIPKRGGEANAARYKPIHDLVREVHAECSANLLPQHEWMSFQSSENSDQLNEIYKKVSKRTLHPRENAPMAGCRLSKRERSKRGGRKKK